MRFPGSALAPLAIGVVLLAQLAFVSPTNFGGYDEWLIVQLTAAGRVSMPYAERPLELVWDMPAPLLFPHRLAAFLWLHGIYLWLSGVLVWHLFTRLAPGQPTTALVAGVLSAGWAPHDFLRLNAIETVAYSGVLFATLAAASLFLESWRRRSTPLLAAAALLALAAARTYESVLPLLFAAPALLWAGPVLHEDRRRRWLFVLAWETVIVLAGLWSVAGVVLPSEGSYQLTALSLDLGPIGVATRLFEQASLHVWPAVAVSWAEITTAQAGIAGVTFLLAAAAEVRRPADAAAPRTLALQAALGLALAILGWSVFVLSPSIRTAARTQFLSAPGVAVLLASLIALVSRLVPARGRNLATLALAAWIVGVGAARTAAMQKQWDASGYWAAQSASLRALAALVPDVQPNTLVVLIDQRGAWPATFTFRHALRLLYDDRAVGLVPGAHDFLYPAHFVAGGVSCEPWPVIREPWAASPTFHRGSEIVVLALAADGSLSVLDGWPAALPAASGAGYAPRARVVAGSPPAAAARLFGDAPR